MNTKLLSAFIVTLFVFHANFAQPKNSLEGFWTGAIEKDGKTWRVDLDVQKEGENLRALIDFIDADAEDLAFSVKQNGDNFILERPQPNGSKVIFEGSIQNGVFRGNWSGTTTKATFSLKHSSAPKKFFREEEISFKNGDVTLSGTLLLPSKKGKHPLVVITHGSGPAERGSYKSWGLRFVKKGIAALVYDKRGNGKSSGEWRTASMEDLARDAVAGVDFLKNHSQINPQKIGVTGHSQGGWIAPLASTMSRGISFVIASAASGVSPDKQSIYHRANVMREMGFSADAVKIATDLRKKLYDSGRLLLENKPNAPEERKKVSEALKKYANEPWFESGAELPPNLDNDNPSRGALELLFFEPVPMWEKVKVPVLLVWGDKDTVVPVFEGKEIIENALKRGGNKDVTTKIFPNVNHGGAIVRPKDSAWDFPRIDLNYYESMADWLSAKLKK